jgi:glycolate oxidase iron-sulfur subunit
LFLRGCVAPELLPEVQAATLTALRHNGCEVVTPPGQTCCGALHFHLGWRDAGLQLVQRNLQAFDRRDIDALVVNAAGCGSTLKEYGELTHDLGALALPARELAARVRDVSEFLDALGLVPPPHAVPARVAYDEPCHLLHGQRVSAAPQRVLDAILGLERVPLAGADRCCGSAGIYNLLHPDLAGAILEEKIAAIAASGADTVATGNAGCILQIRQGLRRAAAATPRLAGVRVVHPMQLLAQAYTGDAPAARSGRVQA